MKKYYCLYEAQMDLKASDLFFYSLVSPKINRHLFFKILRIALNFEKKTAKNMSIEISRGRSVAELVKACI